MSVHEFSVTFPDGRTTSLSAYAGAPLLLVNVASRCGFTPQYAGLEELHRGGLAVIGFPCNQFGGQEPGTDTEIAEFCSTTWSVTFPITTKVEVNGPGADPLWAYLRGAEDIRWNFTKFLVRPDGTVARRYESQVTPATIAEDLSRTAG
ncbi:MAG: Glutathione peroxidase @ Thioredoxin peroxidase [uncultured Corynebacteriales bacterium]|uniref:Glutathione peroxidase n=1 Tax=uncultured Mycobacteriales bacterium TaxID=581187 RepID=A0A6J4JBP5_9ACTN|nr:MAG: Glutathione peroxidase @ Thioredoxin peroxidase [uncultured Corynebacteriales bacterium]